MLSIYGEFLGRPLAQHTDVLYRVHMPQIREYLRALKRISMGHTPVYVEYPIKFAARPVSAVRSVIAPRESAMRANLAMLADFLPVVEAIEQNRFPSVAAIDWHNHMIPVVDALSLMWATRGARTYMEVGSGNSTLYVKAATLYRGAGPRIVSIDPAPRAEVDAVCDEVIRRPVEDIDVTVFDRLESGDTLFIDNSHRSFMNSDVTVCMTEIIPRLRPGVLVGIHDIFLPDDYPGGWAERGYNEQYLLAMCLIANPGYLDIQLSNNWLFRQGAHEEALADIWSLLGERAMNRPPSAFWAVKA